MLAGGRSTRFGRDKLAVDVGGRPLLHYPILRLLEVCDRVVVVIGAEGEEPTLLTDAPATIARDTIADEGPLRGLAAGLQGADAPLAVVVGGDMPDLQPAGLRQMLRAARETMAVAVVLSDGGQARPLPLIVATERAIAATTTLLDRGGRSLLELLDAVSTVVVDEPTWTALDPERRSLIDVDEPVDLDR